MFAKCPNCGEMMACKEEYGSLQLYECGNCGRQYAVNDGVAQEIPTKTRKCPNCGGTMGLEDRNWYRYYRKSQYYYHCPLCGNDYDISRIQLNSSEGNAKKARRVKNAGNIGIVSLVVLLVLIGYVIYGYFFASINFIIIAVLAFVFIVSLVCLFVNDISIYQ